MKRVPLVLILLVLVAAVFLKDPSFAPGGGPSGAIVPGPAPTLSRDSLPAPVPTVAVETITLDHDQDGDGILDLADIVQGARAYVETRPQYKNAYYAGGYPPPGEGVCTDVVWQALQAAGYDLKAMVDKDIRENLRAYPRVAGKPDPNIDFRRVKNLHVFLKRHATALTLEVKPGDAENLKAWQGGDIVVFGPPVDHIAIVSDRRRPDGVPLLLHNAGPYAEEADRLLTWPSPLIGHHRFPKLP
ncbi:MAG TPA: DUF1287 domain-containing protein [Firmicutes bacterium]|uniref:DUF1287 domain-containing protein n=1 Tax=Gelria sp. Kuro-4 TaxID=2796927 RepID=UPI0019CF4047|nr:DUF1287 domain-containing protein [Gelria sp. Kuro-4]BCV25411.1 DUF1287 domain-containing protein [Gelria sp. Kuro-4]HHV56561.1 DUF1287 domain-containing protein [Bacillota bacterium]